MRPRGRAGRTTHELADEELMGLVAANADTSALASILDRHGDAAFSLAYRMCGRRALAEDVVQEAFISLWRSAGRYQAARGSVRNWLLRIVHNRAVDALRSSAAREGALVGDDGLAERMPTAERTDEAVERQERAEAAREALASLPPEQRRVIELAYFSGFTHMEIAQMLQLPVGTVKGRMRLGLSKLRTSLADLREPPSMAPWTHGGQMR